MRHLNSVDQIVTWPALVKIKNRLACNCDFKFDYSNKIFTAWPLICFIILVNIILAGCSSTKLESNNAVQSLDDGEPFGAITDNDVEQLVKFAKEKDYDLDPDLTKAFADDTNALSRIFKFSLFFKSFDKNAHIYGQVIYNSFLNQGEKKRSEQYAQVVIAQDPQVRQRIRDFLYFPVILVPEKERAQVDRDIRENYPQLFPSHYKFGLDDPLFAKRL